MDSTGTESTAGTGAEKDRAAVSLTRATPAPAPAPAPAPTIAEAPDIQSHDTFVIKKTLSLTAA